MKCTNHKEIEMAMPANSFCSLATKPGGSTEVEPAAVRQFRTDISKARLLMFCIGNIARQDDGLGWAFAEAIENSGRFRGEIFRPYQLNIEDAEACSQADTIIFVDASTENLKRGFSFEECTPDGEITFTTHALLPNAIVALTNDLFDQYPNFYLLKISGKEWELGKEMTAFAKENLHQAVAFFLPFLEKREERDI